MQILRTEPLKNRNTLSLQAYANALAIVDSDQQLAQALDWSRAQGLAVLPLGQGSNVVLAGDIDALVISQRSSGLRVIAQDGDEVLLRVAAGHDWHSLVADTLKQKMYGLENLALIPGTVGAAPIQNIGAYGVELERFVRSVQAVDIATGEHLTLTAHECDFAYRDSVFKRELRDRVIITSVDLALSRKPLLEISYPALQSELDDLGVQEPTPADVFAAVVSVRRRRLPDPAQEPNAGSFFKNPVLSAQQAQPLLEQYADMPGFPQAEDEIKIPAAWLIDQLGWKGRMHNGVGVHAGHALVLVNYGSDSGAALLKLATDIVTSVQQRFGITLEIEPRVYGN